MQNPSLPFVTRLWFAFVCLVRVLFDGQFAARAFAAQKPAALPEAPPPPKALTPAAPAAPARDLAPALQLLGLLQREGRLVDFLQQDIATFSDQDIGAAARVVHEGCRKCLAAHLEIRPIRSEAEGSTLTLESGYDAAGTKLTGNVGGTPPYRGVLRHRGWRAEHLKLPTPVGQFDPAVLAPAEVEL